MPFSQRYLDRKIDSTVRPVNMGGDMSLILPHLYLGSLRDRTNNDLMMKNKIKRVLCVIDVPHVIVDKTESKPTHLLNIQAADAQEQDLAQYFEKSIDFIHQARVAHENILVHCHAGVSRSATIVLAYLMTIGDYDVEKALQIVKGARGYIHPNPGFLSQLKKYHANDVKRNWYRLTRRYTSYSFDNDEIFVKGSLNIYWQQFEPAFIAEPVYWSIQTISIYIQCNPQYQNCSLILSNSSSFQRQLRSNVSSTPRLRYTTSISSLNDFDSFSENLKRAAFILAGIALALGILRICLMLCKSRSSTNSISTYPSSFIRSRIDHHHQQFKPDLPPEYAEAIATIENDGSKLPTYEELPYEQRQYQYGYNHTNHGFISTQM